MFLFVSIMRVPDEGCSRNASRALSLIYSFYYMHVLHTVLLHACITYSPISTSHRVPSLEIDDDVRVESK